MSPINFLKCYFQNAVNCYGCDAKLMSCVCYSRLKSNTYYTSGAPYYNRTDINTTVVCWNCVLGGPTGSDAYSKIGRLEMYNCIADAQSWQTETLSARIWIDDQEAADYELTGDDIELNIEALSIGMHDLHVVLLDSKGHQIDATTQQFEVKDPAVTIILTTTADTSCSEKGTDIFALTGNKIR